VYSAHSYLKRINGKITKCDEDYTKNQKLHLKSVNKNEKFMVNLKRIYPNKLREGGIVCVD